MIINLEAARKPRKLNFLFALEWRPNSQDCGLVFSILRACVCVGGRAYVLPPLSLERLALPLQPKSFGPKHFSSLPLNPFEIIMSNQPSILDDPDLMKKLEQDISNNCEMDWLLAHFAYSSRVALDQTPVVNFMNYRYKIVDIFYMTYKQEKAVLETEIATPDVLLILGTYAEYKIMNKLQDLNQTVSKGGHSWAKLLAMCKNDIRMLVNTAFVAMHLFAGDLVPLSDNEIVYCYILAAAVVASINKSARVALSKDIQKNGQKRRQPSISDRHVSRFPGSSIAMSSSTSASSSLSRTFSSKTPKDGSGVSEAAYTKRYIDAINSLPAIDETKRIQETPVDAFIAAAQRLSVRKSCLQSLASVEKALPQVGRLLHLGRPQSSFQGISPSLALPSTSTSSASSGIVSTEPQRLVYYIGEENVATPASDLGSQRYRKADHNR